MAFGVGLGDLALILKTCMDIYKQFKDADETIENASERLQTIRNYVNTVIHGLNQKYGKKENYPRSDHCFTIVQKMEFKAKDVRRIFRKYRETQMQSNVFSAGWQQFLYICGSSTHELQTLMNGLERHRDDLAAQFLTDMAITNSQLQSPNPLPRSARPNVNILFLDSENTGRSVVAQTYAMLVSEWTKRTGNQWKIATIHSAGIDVKHQCGMLDVRQNLPTKLHEGRQSPSSVALSALLDKPFFNHPYKATISENIKKRISRGLGRSTFSEYDYIIVFTLNHLWSMQTLLLEMKKKHPDRVAKGKTKFVVLGEYGNKPNKSNIWGPKNGQTDQEKKEYWNRTVANIKTSFKGWLADELDWKQPPKGAPQN